MQATRIPNLFIVGAPKSETTVLDFERAWRLHAIVYDDFLKSAGAEFRLPCEGSEVEIASRILQRDLSHWLR